MTTVEHSKANDVKKRQVEAALAGLFEAALRRGFFGAAAIEFNVQDGTIQTIRRRLEQTER